ncbi:winged helix-turn-helix domain-containing protein [Nakamurella flavida]|uniref:Winged helix-turn-helix domain-containing protein n=1 Tax=Nakamurella flavida TaxID=363630 RepID=A0A938YPC2_9ACTN|nr:BTAD domain-containing putative transcriptional regulator [Nakamurella flavida]MBM9476515.1 winged helix-turn-helix domain-containing protein [Nakamurella flavida]MDP9779047.1 putative ATPase/DNA-binding SARP family transcriptional activator [Nakamurella flavida]
MDLADGAGLRVGILGPLEVVLDGRPVPVTGGRVRALLARLAVAAPDAVTAAALVEAVWPAGPGVDPTNALQSLVSRVRRALGDPALLPAAPGGYRLAVGAADVDAGRFDDLVTAGRRALAGGRAQDAADTLTEALALWRGTPLPDAGDALWALAPVRRLAELHDEAAADRGEALLQIGRSADALVELAVLVEQDPTRERPVALLMRALAGAGRTAEALALYERLRTALADQLGVDPGAATRAVHLAVLRGEIPLATATATTTTTTTTTAAAAAAAAPVADPTPPPAPATGRHNLRAGLTSFLGRQDEVDRVAGLLTTSRLVSVIGPGGAGKTRLATEVARHVLPAAPDGVWMVELAPVTDGTALGQAFLDALGALDARAVDRRPDRAVRDSGDQLVDLLAESHCLLVVDNCEHLVGPVAALVDRLLAQCPDVRVLATSREPLGILGETLCVVPPLGVPPEGVSAADATGYPAVQLLAERARAVAADFTVDGGTVGGVVEIVRRLDGLPLAIELAAARLRVLSVDEIAARLSDRFRLLTGGSRTAMPRHRTLRAVVAWSWDLLDPDEALLAERLAVFPAGATVDAAVAVCAGGRLSAADIGDLLVSLADKSLLETTNGGGAGQVRHRMLETIREYGMERLGERGEADAARAAHARYYAQLARTLDPVLRTREQLGALRTLAEERGNILAALRSLIESPDLDTRLASQDLVLALAWYWTMVGANTDLGAWAGLVLDATADAPDHPNRVWVRAARATAVLAYEESASDLSWVEMRVHLAALGRELAAAPDPPTPGLTVLRPMLAYFGGDRDAGDAQMSTILAGSDGWLRAATRIGRAGHAENEGDVSLIRADADAALADFERIGDRWGISSALIARASVRSLDGDLAGAIADFEQVSRYSAELGSFEDDTLARTRLATLRLTGGDLPGAREDIEAVRAEIGRLSQGVERSLFADAVLAAILLEEGDLPGAGAMADDLRRRVAQHSGTLMHGHAVAVVGAAVARIAVALGDLDVARADLTRAYDAALTTSDLPILAHVGVGVAGLAEVLGMPETAAGMVGVAHLLQGGEDRSDLALVRLVDSLRARLGPLHDEIVVRAMGLDRATAMARLDPRSLT